MIKKPFSLFSITVFAFILALISALTATKQSLAQTVPNEEPTVVAPSPQSIEQWRNAVSNTDFSGLVLVAHKGEALFQFKFGLANREKGIPFAQDTVFDIGSVTKQFTATAIIKLSQEGALSVEDPITRFFEKVPNDKKHITLHHLLTHSSGLPHGFGLYQTVTSKQLIEEAMSAELKFTPGTQYSYSNAGYSLLGIIIEKVSGVPYEAYLQKNIFTPAGLRNTGYQLIEPHPDKLSVHYGRDPNWLQRLLIVKPQSRSVGHSLQHQMNNPGPRWYLQGGGGLMSTTYDMLRWYQTLRTHNPVILNRTSWDRLFNQYISEGDDKNESFYGYGWRVAKDKRGRAQISHSGSNGYNLTEFTYYPKQDVFIFKTTNNWDDSPVALINQFDDIAIHQIMSR